ncbi:methionine aminopeptidase type I [Rhizobium sp. PP-WC-2G-219]|uniref:type I methionyl aminopeptidase n=1 Tax=Rhizobium sp. PP-CC-3G-465 TaxID=2135648 RepID=UPI000D9C54C0|nr:methionine aminopeptidase type I [Rhizobium sp. PP-CC-3A-592]PYE45198.1 methionine aminopeptidase type I [Rhizobium sp. PP-F2F-G20b]TCL93631.1 methionine aminopeptidase type I [Rhizobium sp. PP-WC-2G-219]TCP90205.1 methionine aminopeptidase type I [Rhizobium sp. PP-CC-2G-626]TCQ10308.1 methionine aminopeptidase type I [Rhizobium sp. PP-F2F-G36]TCQ27608.1 methionine aminopeptidase type I [Rhizobium sp. PP-CC-3G-465]
MTLENADDLERLKEIGRICANALQIMGAALEPGMTTAELDLIGRKALEAEGAQSAPELSYRFPGATCISVNEEVAHGIPGARVIAAGDLVNIDVSAEKGGLFADTGASFAVPPISRATERLCRDGKRAMWVGLNEVKAGKPLAAIGNAIGAFARKNRYTLISNLASHGVGRSLHEEPTEISTWPDKHEKRRMEDGMVFTIEPFLSMGAQYAEGGDDAWTLYSEPRAPTVQYEHTVVVTRNGPLVVTLPG